MTKYLKLPVEVDALQWDGSAFPVGPLMGVVHSIYEMFGGKKEGIMLTLNGTVRIREGDWIVGPGPGGEYWPVRDDIFRVTYRLADQSTQSQENDHG